jgi:hypothetical protein
MTDRIEREREREREKERRKDPGERYNFQSTLPVTYFLQLGQPPIISSPPPK